MAKRFGATVALKSVSLEVAPGEIHAIIGENGAGKSTLMKILSGACRPDSGSLHLDGVRFDPEDPHAARQAGVAMIYQELILAPHLSVEENILLGEEPARLGWINSRSRREQARAALAQLHYEHLPLGAPVGSLPIAEQQVVEIARALIREPRLLILDEPTSSLTQVDTQRLFAAIRRLRDRGVSVLYISHFLEECQLLCDRFTVLRDGESVGSGAMASTPLAEIIHRMVGRNMEEIYPRSARSPGEVLLELKGLSGRIRPSEASLLLRRGEILGVAGLVGAGRTEMLRATFGLDPVAGGEILVRSSLRTHASPRQRLRDKIGLLSEDRKEEGLLLNRSLADNVTMTRFEPVSRWGFINPRVQKQVTRDWMTRLKVRARSPFQPAAQLSGGNQQKIALGRLLHHEADILLLDEPTRGIDVGSKAEIYRLIHELAGQGKGILFVSSYLPELLGVCDTLAVMCRGVLGPKRPVAEWTEHSIIEAAVGAGTEKA